MPYNTVPAPARLKFTALGVLLAAHVQMPALGAVPGALDSPDGDAWVSIEQPHLYADVYLDSDRYTGVYTLTTRATDVGAQARLLLVARLDEQWYSHNGRHWVPWTSGRISDLQTWASKTLAASEQLVFLSDEELPAGDYTIYAGYQIGSNTPIYNDEPLSFTVQPAGSDSLLPFGSDQAMEAYLKQGLQNAGSISYSVRNGPQMVATAGVAFDKSGAGRTSSTNIQEAGVDEADTVKVDGNHLYTLSNCKEKACLDVHTLDSANATSTPLSSFMMDSTLLPNGMFLVENGVLGQKTMVTVAGQNNYWGWFNVWGWSTGKTELQFLNISNPAAITRAEKLTFDGSLVASRRVGDVLYVVTRYTPALEGYYPYPTVKAEEDANARILAVTPLPEILPRVEDSRKQVEELVKSRDCYLPTSAVDGNLNPSIITITSIPLNAPTNHSSKCFLGGSETLYMTTSALYLATTSRDYQILPAAERGGLIYSPDHTTAIHKFALSGASIQYRGSAEVKGHLGWSEDKKSFRMGENRGYLNIATSIGETWDDSSTTRLTVLKEVAGNKLQTVKTIDGIGLKGEELYAARFLGDRGYLVTFRITDPLYVLDLSNQEQPKIAGELKINGYSDYLHPVAENLLLGIGKDAIPDTRSPDEGGRGAWYQGVKLSLFDVSNIARPLEVNSRILGKRGTQSDVLTEHHALAFLPATGTEPARLAIPVRLHDKVPAWAGWKASDPGAWYDYTHTALYSFEISAQGISQAGRIIGEVAGNIPGSTDPRVTPALGIVGVEAGSRIANASLIAPIGIRYTDRSVLKDDAVYYVHEGKVLSARWGENR